MGFGSGPAGGGADRQEGHTEDDAEFEHQAPPFLEFGPCLGEDGFEALQCSRGEFSSIFAEEGGHGTGGGAFKKTCRARGEGPGGGRHLRAAQEDRRSGDLLLSFAEAGSRADIA